MSESIRRTDSGVPIATQVGQEWTQANETQNIETQATMGFKGFSCFPGDPDGANNLFRELKAHGRVLAPDERFGLKILRSMRRT